jgi:hypothetical protein
MPSPGITPSTSGRNHSVNASMPLTPSSMKAISFGGRTGQIFEPADGRLRAQILAALRQPPDRHLEGGIDLKGGIDLSASQSLPFGIAPRDQQGAIADHVGHFVPHPIRVARVFKAGSQALGDPKPPADSNRMPASEVSRPPSNPTSTVLPATAGRSGRIPVLSAMAGANALALGGSGMNNQDSTRI